MKKIFLFSLSIFITLSLIAQIPSGYYETAVGKKQAELKTALHLIIKTANVPSYGSGANSTWAAFAKMDIRPEDGTVWDMYSNNHVAFNGNSAASGMNIEHSFAKSWWGDGRQAAQDVQHLCPSNSTANSAKGSWPMALVDGTTTFTNGCIKVGKSSSKAGMTLDAWEPADEYKGDFARMYMYMVTAYEDYATLWTGNSVNQLDNNTYPVFEQWTVDLLLQWNKQDPVSQKEITRTNEAYKVQGNRNPYIDYPELADYIWGDKKTLAWSINGSSVGLTSPTNGATLDFGKVAYQQTDTASIYIKGMNLTGDLTIALSGANASYFNLPATTISQSNAMAGFKFVINYVAQAIGTHTAVITISGGGIATSTITLTATATDSFMALAASNITNNSFTANWSNSANATDYSLNVFSYVGGSSTVSQTLLEEDFASALPSTWTSSGYIGTTDLAGNIRLASGSSAGAITSPAINMSSPTTFMVTAKQYSSDAGAKLTVKVNTDSITSFTTSASNQDFTVNIPAKTASSNIFLSAAKGIRVYVDYVKLVTQSSVQTPLSVSGYPKLVGNELNYTVTGLQSDSAYYYTVTPQGNSATKSDPIKVRTAKTGTGFSNVNVKNIFWQSREEGLFIYNLPENSQVIMTDMLGRKLIQVHASSTLQINSLSKGVYLMQIKNNTGISTCKIRY